MLIEGKPLVTELGRHHKRELFTCGVRELDQYLKRFALQDVRRRITRVFVALQDERDRIGGFYTLSAASVESGDFPDPLASKLPRYPIPVARIGRLAVDNQFKGIGLGCYLLMDAIRRVLSAGNYLGIFALIVDAKDNAAKAFYRKYGFVELMDRRFNLFLTVETIKKIGLDVCAQ